MIKKLERSSSYVMGMEIEGEVSIKQMRELEPEIESLIKEHGKVSFLLVFKEFSGYGVKEMMGDVHFAIKHWSDIERIAVVGDKKWEEIGVKIDNFFAKWDEKFFHVSELDQAWAWVEGN